MKNFIFILFLTTMFLALPSFAQQQPTSDSDVNYAPAKILEIVSEKNNDILENSFHTKQVVQTAKVLVLGGKYKGETVYIENQLTASPAYDINIKKGERVILSIEKTPQGTDFYISDLDRMPFMMILAGIFLLLLLLIGGKQGIRSIISLVITSVLVFFVLVPAVMANYPVIPVTIGVAFASTVATMLIVAGKNLKSLAAILGTGISVFAAGAFAMIAIKFMPLNGFGSQEAGMLWADRPDLNYTGILAASVIIASLGAVMDVGISIASSIAEVKKVNPSLTSKELIFSGLNVGKDIMGTMSNTLILAYIGSSFFLVLLASNAPLVKLLNLNSIASEITSALAGSIGIVLCVPITAIISGFLIEKYSTKNSFRGF